MPRYSEQQKAALDALMKDTVYEKAIAIVTGEDLQALTMERLARDVGVSRGTIYNYFADRDAVVDFVVDRTFGPCKAAVESAARSDLSPAEQLTTIIEWVFDTLYDDRALVIALGSAGASNKGNSRSRRDRHDAIVAAVATVIGNGVKSGEFRDLPPTFVGEIFFAAVRGLVDSMVDSGEFLPAAKVVPTFKRLFLDGLSSSPGAGLPGGSGKTPS